MIQHPHSSVGAGARRRGGHDALHDEKTHDGPENGEMSGKTLGFSRLWTLQIVWMEDLSISPTGSHMVYSQHIETKAAVAK